MRRLIAFLVDLILVAVATGLAVTLRENFDVAAAKAWVLLPHFSFTMIAATIVIPLFGLHRSVWRFSSLTDYLYLVGATVVIVVGAVLASFALNRLDGVARSVPFLQAILILPLLVGARVFMRLRHAQRQDPAVQFLSVPDATTLRPPSVLLVGITRLTELYLQSAHELTPGKVHVAGLLGRTEKQTGRLMHRYPVLGTPEQVSEIIKTLEIHGVLIDRIIVTTRWENLGAETRTALRDVEATSNVQVVLLAQTLGFDNVRPVAEPELKSPNATRTCQTDPTATDSDGQERQLPEAVLTVSPDERDRLRKNGYWAAKRGFDVVSAFILIVLMLPVMAVVALLALIDVGRPILFWQQRPGLVGRPFRLYKLRTMKAAHDESGALIPDDKRVSRIGRFLRATRLDELPQLFHILNGQMSFVGPRPLLPVDQPAEFAARLLVRPGLTGWAQVRGGRLLSAADKAALDVWYVRNASLRLDLEILLRTFGMVLFGEKPSIEAIGKAWQLGSGNASSDEGSHKEALTLSRGEHQTRRVA